MSAELPARDAFAGCLHTRFRVLNVQPEPVDLVLEEVSQLKEMPGRQSFSLFFLGPVEGMLPQHIYRLQHAALGEMDLFLVPVGRRENGFEYEAVFNLLKPAGR